LLAPDFPRVRRQRGADAMWTTLFAVTFAIALALHLVVLSEVD
jgi:hypothetical protein